MLHYNKSSSLISLCSLWHLAHNAGNDYTLITFNHFTIYITSIFKCVLRKVPPSGAANRTSLWVIAVRMPQGRRSNKWCGDFKVARSVWVTYSSPVAIPGAYAAQTCHWGVTTGLGILSVIEERCLAIMEKTNDTHSACLTAINYIHLIFNIHLHNICYNVNINFVMIYSSIL